MEYVDFEMQKVCIRRGDDICSQIYVYGECSIKTSANRQKMLLQKPWQL